MNLEQIIPWICAVIVTVSIAFLTWSMVLKRDERQDLRKREMEFRLRQIDVIASIMSSLRQMVSCINNNTIDESINEYYLNVSLLVVLLSEELSEKYDEIVKLVEERNNEIKEYSDNLESINTSIIEKKKILNKNLSYYARTTFSIHR